MLILASASPRRAELLRQIGIDFVQQPADIVERRLPNESPRDYVLRLAREKALAIGQPESVVLGSDTTVVLGGETLGKPRDEADAVDMLLQLSDRWHEVMSAVAVVHRGEVRDVLSVSRVRFRALNAAEAAAYWATGEPADKAGSYAIQGLGAAFVARMEGSYSGVMGLPLFETVNLLREHNITVLP